MGEIIMSKELETLEKLRQNLKDDTHLFDDELLDIIEVALNEYEKTKFVIKTIKEKGVHLSGTGEAYTEEEYDAIKEILL